MFPAQLRATGRYLAVGRQPLPWDYFRVVRDSPGGGSSEVPALGGSGNHAQQPLAKLGPCPSFLGAYFRF